MNDQLRFFQARILIDEVRLILHTHWVAFNHLGVQTIDFDEWDAISLKLDILHDEYPTLVADGYEAEYFQHWDTCDWSELPVTPYVLDIAIKMVEREEYLAGLKIA